jgi:hypothetical protein
VYEYVYVWVWCEVGVKQGVRSLTQLQFSVEGSKWWDCAYEHVCGCGCEVGVKQGVRSLTQLQFSVEGE